MEARHGAGAKTRPIAIGGVLVAVVAWGCASPSPLAIRHPEDISLEGATVIWTSTDPTLGAVRFGRRPGEYRMVAYPAAAGRSDKVLERDHRVTLLGVASGDTVYAEVMDRGADGSLMIGVEQRFIIGPGVPNPSLMRWTMIDVGFGDAHLLTMPGTGEHVLIDAGERRDAANVETYLGAAHVTRLDAVLATHIHEDHIGGMVGEYGTISDGVLGAWDVGAFLEGPDHSASRTAYDELLATIGARGIPRRVVRPGDTQTTNAALAWDPAVGVEVLNAGGGRAQGGADDGDWLNNDSVVLRVSYGQVHFVLGGDAESPVQSRLIAERPRDLEAEVLKVHHHGLNDSSDPAYLSAVNARVGLIPITTYESDLGTLPSQVVLDRLRARLTDIFCSDRAEPLGIALSGDAGIDVTVLTDGNSYEVRVAPSSSRHWPGGWTGAATDRRTDGAAAIRPSRSTP